MSQAPYPVGMGSRLDRVNDWENRARAVKYRVSSLARNVGVTRRQLERYFLRTFSSHPKRWVQDLRIKDAIRLKQRGLLDKEIAARLGFKQASHFSRVFKRHRPPKLKALRIEDWPDRPGNVAKGY